MRTSSKTITRREHWRWQRCGPGRATLRRILVRETRVTLAPGDTRQLDMLEPRITGTSRHSSRDQRRNARRTAEEAPREVLRSYWRRQPFGPGGAMRKTILIDVRG